MGSGSSASRQNKRSASAESEALIEASGVNADNTSQLNGCAPAVSSASTVPLQSDSTKHPLPAALPEHDMTAQMSRASNASKKSCVSAAGEDFFRQGSSAPASQAGDETSEAIPCKRMSFDYRSFLPERFEVDVTERYNIDKLAVGEGGYGQVFIAMDKEVEGRRVAVKKVVLSAADPERKEAVWSEVKLMKDLDHPNICKLLEVFEQGRTMFFVMEYCEGGEVFDRIVQNQYINEEIAASIILQVASALRYAHGRKIAHRDIKPENIVFCTKSANDNTIKVIDWGLGMGFAENPLRGAVGSFTYAAPEVVNCTGEKSYTDMCDLWSLGVVSYVMLCGKPPFWGSQREHLRKARAEQYPLSKHPWDIISDPAKDFVRKLLKANPKDRLPIDKVTEHPWLNKVASESNCREMTQVLTNLKYFSNSSRFQAICAASVARQLDHRHLRRIHRVFRQMDVRGDGVLSFQEVSDGFKQIFGDKSREYLEAREIFDQMDLDGSGTIDYTEFCAAGMGQYAAMQDDAVWAAFKSFDLDDSGTITKQNLQKVLSQAGMLQSFSEDVCKEVAEEIVRRLDGSGSGEIDFDEWKEMMRQCWEEKTLEEAAGSPAPPPAMNLMREASNCSVKTTTSVSKNMSRAYEVLRVVSGLDKPEPEDFG